MSVATRDRAAHERRRHRSHREPLIAAEPGKLRTVKARELAMRFVFGAAVSIVAGLVSISFGDRAGGMFLAFPGILPATLTLIEKKESTTASVHGVSGAVAGGVGLAAFAVVVTVTAGRMSAAAVLGLALAAWVVVSFAGYGLWQGARRLAIRSRRHEPTLPPGHAADVRTTGSGV